MRYFKDLCQINVYQEFQLISCGDKILRKHTFLSNGYGFNNCVCVH